MRECDLETQLPLMGSGGGLRWPGCPADYTERSEHALNSEPSEPCQVVRYIGGLLYTIIEVDLWDYTLRTDVVVQICNDTGILQIPEVWLVHSAHIPHSGSHCSLTTGPQHQRPVNKGVVNFHFNDETKMKFILMTNFSKYLLCIYCKRSNSG